MDGRGALALLGAALALAACGGAPPPGSSSGEDGAAAGGPPAAFDRAAVPAGLDVLLITIDTLRHDALGYAAGHDATPTIDRLAAGGRVFTNAHAHNVVTLPSHANVLTGLYPYQHGVRENSGFELPPAVPTLATVLGDAGYRTAAVVGAFPLDARYGLDRGFELYDDHYPKGSHASDFVMAERRGDEVVERGLAWWRRHAGDRRFLWLHLYDPHAPYEPPEPFASRYPGDPYRGEVAAVDGFLAPLLEPLLDGREEPTLVVLTADHGEAFGDHGELTHGLFAYEATLKVPLVIWGPGIAAGEDRRPVGHVDLMPTVLDVLGLAPPAELPGRSLLSGRLGRRELYFEALSAYLNRGWAPLYGVLRGADKLIDLPLPELYDLVADPAELDNRIERERRLARRLRDAVPAAARQVTNRRTISEEEAAHLRSLGYLSGDAPRRDSFTAADDPKNLLAVDRKIHQVVLLYGQRRLAEAERLGREIVRQQPRMTRGYTLLSEVLREAGKIEAAIAVLRSALASGVRDPSILRQLGLSLAQAGRGREAVELLEPLAADDDLDVLNSLAVAYFASGRPAAARAAVERVLARDEDNPKALETLGAVALQEGRPAEAVRHLERVLALDPNLPISWNSLGVARQLLGDTGGALAAWQKAVELDPDFLDPLYNLGRVAAQAGRPELARSALERYVAIAPPAAADVAVARRILGQLERR
ncbi:MAG: tetratricopeptide repeat protein [Acidobacteria bacterium]|nr:MAG: tetratricopeptide repeat protein [Acidobacteriota bacterium]